MMLENQVKTAVQQVQAGEIEQGKKA